LTSVALPARAKLNLDLSVVSRRADGFHELRTRMQAIELHDLLEAEAASETSLTTTGFELLRGGTNSVLSAHCELEKVAGRPIPTRFRLHKRIPPGSGLGGASSDAAAAMRAIVSIHHLEGDLKELAPRIGADVTFFLTGGAARVEGIGERVTPIPADDSWFAIAWPGVELSTAGVYRAWDRVGGEGLNGLRRAAGETDRRVNDFAALLGAGWQMTGSGSAFFLRCPDRKTAAAAIESLTCWTAVSEAVGAWS
jgi:4-diphosphocytidyl-2C-methyl-D-erythritol kinase